MIAIIGAGFSGLGLAIRLRKEGREDFVVLERAAEVGGTWRDNTYPGCACDVQSHLYSFSFAPNPSWSANYSPQPEILEYLKRVTDENDVRRFIKFNTTVRMAKWSRGEWVIETSEGQVRASALVMAIGPLSEPSFPKVEGLKDFRGEIFHSAEWNPRFDPRGKRIAVVGSGASAVQFIPILQKQAAKLVVFQRTAAWVVPRANRKFTALEKFLYARVPGARRAVRFAVFFSREVLSYTFRHPRVMKVLEWFSMRQLAKDVKDPVLRAKLTPKYTIGCKRILLTDDYWPALAQPNVEVVTDGIERLDANAVVAGDHRYEVDAVIFATGFHVTDSPFYSKVIGRGGQTLADVWEGSPRAFLGTSLHGFPNLFFLLGPNTGLGHTSVVLMIEAQIGHLLKVLSAVRAGRTVEPRQDVQDAWVREVDEDLKHTVWNSGGCSSWYIDRTGRNSTIWPKTVASYQKLMKSQDMSAYEIKPIGASEGRP